MLNDLGSYLKEITELVQKVLFFFCRVKRWVFLNDKHEHSLKTICDRFWIKTIITCPAIMWPRHTAPLSPTFSSLNKVERLCCWKYVIWYWTFKWTFFSGLFKEQSERVWSECNLKSGWIAEFVRSQAMSASFWQSYQKWKNQTIENKKILVCCCSKKQSKCL